MVGIRGHLEKPSSSNSSSVSRDIFNQFRLLRAASMFSFVKDVWMKGCQAFWKTPQAPGPVKGMKGGASSGGSTPIPPALPVQHSFLGFMPQPL